MLSSLITTRVALLAFIILNLQVFEGLTLDVAVYMLLGEKSITYKSIFKILESFYKRLPTRTAIQIFWHKGTKNEEMIYKLVVQKRNSSLGRQIHLSPLERKSLQFNIKDYSNFMTSEEFYEKVRGEMMLVFQSDSVLCSEPSLKWEDFMRFDYVGAPWPVKWHGDIGGGNGGLSLRNRTSMIRRIQRQVPIKKRHPEDLYFAKVPYLR